MSEQQPEPMPDMTEALEVDLPDPGQTEHRNAEPPLTKERGTD